jgi:tetratricopeptide (TPR) repeat protein
VTALARSLREEGEAERAASWYRAVLARNPDDREAKLGLLLLLITADPSAGSLLDEIELGLLRRPSDAELRVAKAWVLWQTGRRAEADRLVRDVLADVPFHADARCLKAHLLADEAERAGASQVALLSAAVRISGGAPDMRVRLIKALCVAGRAAEAVDQFGRLPSGYRLRADALAALARAFEEQGRHDAASTLLDLAVRTRSGAAGGAQTTQSTNRPARAVEAGGRAGGSP